MADPLSTAAATAQFIGQSIKIGLLCKRIYDKVQGGPKELQGWRDELEGLQDIVERVQRSPELKADRKIGDVIQNCTAVGNDLGAIFDHLTLDPTVDSIGWRTWKAIGGLAREPEIRDLFARLERLKGTLALQVDLVNSPSNQKRKQGLQLTEVAENVRDIKSTIQPGTEEERCLRELFVTDPTSDRDAIITAKGDRTAGTCEWIMSTDEYKAWGRSQPGLLWISGPPGKGKTFISIFLTQNLETDVVRSGSTLIYFFCDNQTSTRNTATNILRGLMYQLIQQHNQLLSLVLQQWKVQQDNLFKDNAFESLWRIFDAMLSSLGDTPIFAVLDALDECNETSLTQLLHKLNSIFGSHKRGRHRLSIVILSRRHPTCLPEALSAFPHVQIDDKLHDIELYIVERVRQIGVKKDIIGLPLLHHIEGVFRERSGRTFLWVSLMAADLEKKLVTELESSLESLPRGLDAVYGRILAQIRPDHEEPVAELLSWIALAHRWLSVAELCEAMRIQPTRHLSREQVCMGYIEACGHFLQCVDLSDAAEQAAGRLQQRSVRFVHQSAQDFLLREPPYPGTERFSVDEERGHVKITTRLIHYLDEGCLGGCLDKSDVAEYTSTSSFPLTHYAIWFWMDHMCKLRKKATVELVYNNPNFFAKKSRVRNSWFKETHGEDETLGSELSILHIASHQGIYYLAEHLLQKRGSFKLMSSEINKRCVDGDGYTPLLLACENGHERIVTLLLNHGADPRISTKDEDETGDTSLKIAIRNGQLAVFKVLATTKHGLKLIRRQTTSPESDNSNLLVLAALYGFEDGCNMLIDTYGYDVDAMDSDHDTPLMKAIQFGHLDTAVRLIKQHNARVDEHRLLESACQVSANRVTSAISTVLDLCHVNINCFDDKGNTFLFKSVSQCCTRPSSLLTTIENFLSRGYDLSKTNNEGQTLVHALFNLGSTITEAPGPGPILALLLGSGIVNINGRDDSGQTALHVFTGLLGGIYRGLGEDEGLRCATRIVTQVLDFGADRSITDSDGCTALELGLRLGYGLSRSERMFPGKRTAARRFRSNICWVLENYATVPIEPTVVPLTWSINEDDEIVW
ncbi:hypothetical protein FZEAL_6953 [Fusarium zealandicum]|uniref:Nephrocystin 3-like N-terminal domain-containing protein n=1 Tax=Fusarium zealandicum TaxID=1053134 RepID=A0A8H4XIZ0_9HYPO|nr:hypothetical protein FZEAL_6953 [Fusarium zealandicum]